MKGRSTETALLAQKEIILKSFEDKKLCIGIFVDFSKAFDRLCHYTLIEKLEMYGIRGIPLSLLKSYLKCRSQCVKINNYFSSLQPITTGVPQGSILGPLLFNLYINDIVKISDKPKYIIYADDTSIFFTGNDMGALTTLINTTLESLNAWSEQNSLVINASKTKAVIFHSRMQITSPGDALRLGSATIEIVETVKTLGVFFNCRMSWEPQISKLITNISKCVGILARLRSLLPVSVKITLYNSLFLSHVSYCFLVWGSTTATNINRLYKLQKKAIRHIANVDYYAHTGELFKRFNIIPIHQLYEYYLAIRYKKSLLNSNRAFLDIFQLEPYIIPYPTRHQQHWIIPFCRTHLGRQMLRFTVPVLLNKLIQKRIKIEERGARAIREALLS